MAPATCKVRVTSPWPDPTLPVHARGGCAKTERLQALKALGVTFRAAYGNARTDIHAYAALGIDKARTFILGKHGGEEGTVKLGEAFPGE